MTTAAMSNKDTTWCAKKAAECMQNPKILRHFSNLLPVKLLKRCRLVCKQWYEASLPRWRFEMVYVVRQERIRGHLSIFKLWRITKDSADPYQLAENPIRNYKLFRWDIKPGAKDVSFFIHTYAHLVSYLGMEQANIYSVKTFLHLVLHRHLENMREIHFYKLNCLDRKFQDFNIFFNIPEHVEEIVEQKCCKLISTKVMDKFPIKALWEVLSLRYTSVEHIHLRDVNMDETFLLETAKKAQRTNSEYWKLMTFDTIYMNDIFIEKLPQDFPSLIHQMGLPLTTLKLDIGHKMEVYEVQPILGSCATSLKTLHLHRGPFAPPYKTFPFETKLPNLQELKLWGPVTNSFSFLKFTPNLKILHVVLKDDSTRKANTEKFMEMPMENIFSNSETSDFVKLAKMTELKLDVVHQPENEHVHHLLNSIPDLKCLQMFMPGEAFPRVCESWPELTKLHITVDETMNDDVFSGVVDNKLRTRNSITNLRNLRELTVHKPKGVIGKLTDISVKGILQLDFLQRIDIDWARQVSDTAVANLREKFGEKASIWEVPWERQVAALGHDPDTMSEERRLANEILTQDGSEILQVFPERQQPLPSGQQAEMCMQWLYEQMARLNQ